MKLSMANNPFGRGLAATDVDDEPHDQAGKVEAPVESVSEGRLRRLGKVGGREGWGVRSLLSPLGQSAELPVCRIARRRRAAEIAVPMSRSEERPDPRGPQR